MSCKSEFSRSDFENDFIAEEDYFDGEGEDAFLYTLNFAYGGSAESMRVLGDVYSMRGHGVKVDFEKAIFWYQRAVDRGDKCATLRLAEILYCTDGAPKNYERAFELYKLSADGGVTLAVSRLGKMYLYGHGAPKDFGKARGLIKQAAEEGEREACYEYAHILKNEGADGWRDYLKKAANQSWGKAAWELYNILLEEGGTDKRQLFMCLNTAYYDEQNLDAETRARAKTALDELKTKI